MEVADIIAKIIKLLLEFGKIMFSNKFLINEI